MNNFEDKLQGIIKPLVRHDPTPAWKAEILSRSKVAGKRPFGGMIMIGSILCIWLLIAVMELTMPVSDLSSSTILSKEEPEKHPAVLVKNEKEMTVGSLWATSIKDFNFDAP